MIVDACAWRLQVCPEVDSLIQQLATGKGEFFDYVDDATHEALQNPKPEMGVSKKQGDPNI